MKARINAGQGLGFGFGFGGRHGGFGGFKANRALMQSLTTAELNAAAAALHMSTADLQSALKSGKSLSDLETQQKVSDSAVKSAMTSAAKGVLDNAVKAGTITQAQADAILSRVGSGLKFRSHNGDNESNETPGGQAPTTPAPTTPSPSPAAYYSTI
jgi:hypothetical protein